MSNRTQKEIVLNHLQNGKTLSIAQAKNSFRIGNPYEVIRRLRADGNPVYSNRVKGKTVYRLGTPRKAAVANHYRDNGAGGFA